jgi:hypothetical protein
VKWLEGADRYSPDDWPELQLEVPAVDREVVGVVDLDVEDEIAIGNRRGKLRSDVTVDDVVDEIV